MPNSTLRYTSYILRCWEEVAQTPQQPALWRFSLEDVQTGVRHGFSDLAALMTFLHAQAAAPQPGPADARPD